MRLVRGQHNLHHAMCGGSVTIGVFDGVHRGHQTMIRQLQARGPAPHTVMTFEPMPLEVLAPERAPARLSSLRERLHDLDALGVDQCLLLRFDERLAGLSPAAFVQDLLVHGLGARRVLVGDDFRYGARRAGTFGSLRDAGHQAGFEVEQLDTVMDEQGQRISSTRVRQALARGDVAQANALLGRGYRMSGRVQRGQGKGAGLGFATANLLVRRKPALRFGVYATRMHLPGGQALDAVSNLGVRPSMAGSSGCWLETHGLDWQGSLYGQRVAIEFVAFLRPERRFDSLEALTAQIDRDVAAARQAHAAATR